MCWYVIVAQAGGFCRASVSQRANKTHNNNLCNSLQFYFHEKSSWPTSSLNYSTECNDNNESGTNLPSFLWWKWTNVQ